MALVTKDLALYHRLVPLFEHAGLPLLGLRPDEPIPPSVQALLGGPDSDARSVPLRDHDEATLLAAMQQTGPHAEGHARVVFGVDPGKTIGLAVLGDGEPLLVAECLDPLATVERVAAWMAGLTSSSWSVHVGDGAPDIGQEIAKGLADTLPSVLVHFVSEASTTPRAPVTGSRHADAAVRIAMRSP